MGIAEEPPCCLQLVEGSVRQHKSYVSPNASHEVWIKADPVLSLSQAKWHSGLLVTLVGYISYCGIHTNQLHFLGGHKIPDLVQTWFGGKLGSIWFS